MANYRRLLAIFWKTLLVASFGNNTWDLIVWNSVFVAILFWKQLLLQLLKARVTLMFGLLGVFFVENSPCHIFWKYGSP